MFYCSVHGKMEDVDYVGFFSPNGKFLDGMCDEGRAELYPDPWTCHGVTHPGSMGPLECEHRASTGNT
jgi:hypothetical protein